MNITAVDQINSLHKATKIPSPEEMRKVAQQFEALLLTQLTSALNKTSDAEPEDGAENLFGGDGGTALAKQMFSEQLATTMAQSGGVGLADVIFRQLGGKTEKSHSGKLKGLNEAISVVKDIKQLVSEVRDKGLPLINKAAKALPFTPAEFKGDPNEAEVISTFEDQIRNEGSDDSMKNLVLDGKIVNTTRPRLAPNSPITLVPDVSPVTNIGPTSKPAAGLPFQMPVEGRVSSGFGNRFHPIDKKVKFHAGTDIAVPLGTSVKAASDGVVSFAGWENGYGNLVVIKHADGRETRYGHLQRLMVAEGGQVSAGQEIALSGSTGKSTGPHLHFEVRENGQVVDPIKILAKGLPYNAER